MKRYARQTSDASYSRATKSDTNASRLTIVAGSRRREIRRGIAVVEIVAPARLAAIGMDQRAAEDIEICRVHEPAGRAGHMRLAVHGRECGDIAEGAHRLRLVPGEMRLAAVFDHLDAVLTGDFDDLVDLRGIACGVDDDGGGDVRRDAFGELLGPDIVAVRLAVDEPRFQSIEYDGGKRPRVGDGRDQDLASLRQIERGHRDVEGGRAGRDGIGITAAHHLDEGIGIDFLERALIAGIDLALGIVVEHLEHHPSLVFAESDPRRHRRLAHGLAAVDRERSRVRRPRGGLDRFVHARPTLADTDGRSMPWALSRSSWLP